VADPFLASLSGSPIASLAIDFLSDLGIDDLVDELRYVTGCSADREGARTRKMFVTV
jgi:hypothetical protein